MLDRKACMKIQLRAATEVVLGTIGFIVAINLINVGAEYLLENYGFKGLLLALGTFVMLLFMNLIYQIRVSQLKFEEKQKVDQK